jgi:release factor glutamine methyltransferase
LEGIQKSAEFLATKGVDSPRLQAELLLAHVLHLPRMKLYLNFERPLSAAERDALRELVKRRGKREPLQHLTGSTSFCGLELTVNRHVLVPRPETELLAEAGWQFLNALPTNTPAPRTALDFGTGSGCIAIALACNTPPARIVALDASADALTVAKLNAERHQVSERIEFRRSHGFGGLERKATFDLIISNPPYIATAEIATLQPEVRDFDPHMALDGGADGLDFYRLIAEQARGYLKAAGRLMLEFGDGQAEALKRTFQKQGWAIEAIVEDYTKRPRILVASSRGS